jgi:hypothetical protein
MRVRLVRVRWPPPGPLRRGDGGVEDVVDLRRRERVAALGHPRGRAVLDGVVAAHQRCGGEPCLELALDAQLGLQGRRDHVLQRAVDLEPARGDGRRFLAQAPLEEQRSSGAARASRRSPSSPCSSR